MALKLRLKYCLSYQDDYLKNMALKIKQCEKALRAAADDYQRANYIYDDCVKEVYLNPDKAMSKIDKIHAKKGIDKALKYIGKLNDAPRLETKKSKEHRAEKIEDLKASIKNRAAAKKNLQQKEKDLSVEKRLEKKASKLRTIKEAMQRRAEMEAKTKEQEKERGYSLDR